MLISTATIVAKVLLLTTINTPLYEPKHTAPITREANSGLNNKSMSLSLIFVILLSANKFKSDATT